MRLFSLVSLLVVMAVVALSVGVALSQQVNPARAVPDTVGTGESYNVTPTRFLPESGTVEKEGTFKVIVNFTSNAPGFRAVTLTDLAPTNWTASVYRAKFEPDPKSPSATGNKTEVLWTGGSSAPWYLNNTYFTVEYNVTVSPTASVGNYSSFNINNSFLTYYVSTCTTGYFEYVTGGSELLVTPPAICSNTSIDFYVLCNGTKNETLELWSSTPCWINNWTVTDDANYTGHDWLSGTPPNGSCNSIEHSFVALSVNSSKMPAGDYFANITIEAPYPEANNSPRIVPVTLHVTDSGVLKGHVDFCRKNATGDPTWKTVLVVRFFDNATRNETVWSPINVTTDAYGNFTIDKGIDDGTYDVAVKNWTTLSKMKYGQEFTGATITPINFGLLTEGDTDNDDFIKGGDYNDILTRYFLDVGDPLLDPNKMYDFDRSGRVSGFDYNQVLTRYFWKGDLYTYLD